MRLHGLEVTAFGPFPDTARIDFDALSDAGLFLLSGPTGAGKSSVLDAVCFALYGDVPGDRSTAKRLRCDQAEEGVAPRVLLEATVSGRRFRIDRSPAWTRPKRRGTGTTTEQARVVISELVHHDAGSQWRPLSTRLDETGHLVTRLVGMNLTQFCQVALLPQGRFQAFLRAGSEERHALLQQVFQTGRFDQVEGWLRTRRLELNRASGDHQSEVTDLVSRLSEVAAATPPADWVEDPGSLAAWATDQASDADERRTASARDVVDAEASEEAARSAEEVGLALDRAVKARAAAHEEATRLDEARAREQDVVRRLDAARRAEPLRTLHAVAQRAAQRAATAERQLDTASAAVARLTGGDPPDPGTLADLRRSVLGTLTEVARMRPLQARIDEITGECQSVHAALVTAREVAGQVDGLARSLPGMVDDQRSRLAEATNAAARLPGVRAELLALRQRSQAAARAGDLEVKLSAAETEAAQALAEVQQAKEAWLDLRERRLDGMAAEIASALVVGGCCPVCGSDHHPAPATAAPDAPTGEAERRSRKRVDDLEALHEVQTQHARGLSARLAAARATAGDDTDDLAGTISGVEATHLTLETQAEGVGPITGEVARLEGRLRDVADELRQATARVADLEAQADRLAQERAVLVGQVQAVLAGSGCDDLEVLAASLAAVEEATDAAETALSGHATAVEVLEEAIATAAAAASEAGFASLTAGLASLMDPAEAEGLAAWLTELARARERLAEILADEALQAAVGVPPPDLARLAEAHRSARVATLAARRTHHSAEDCAQRLAGLSADLQDALARWAPVRSDFDAVAALASFVEGKSADNRLQMRLSAYVLSHRLTQVVDAANLRLATMSDRRYSLVHTGRRGAGERRGGLSLLVRDDWSGESRDPATLSGGETFVVSLALALGLADVITSEAGGAELDTLFVDEGFGSLDADTLDDVMDTLDSLRDGGRVVGVVSHVAEMQTRIPVQLRVHKGREGSRVSQ